VKEARGEFATLNAIPVEVMILEQQRQFLDNWLPTRGYRNSKSRTRGVYETPKGRWQAVITKYNKSYYLGTFDTTEQAAVAYDSKANELYGSKAKLNSESPFLEPPRG